MRKIRVLFLVANPFTTTRSELDAKMRAICHKLQNLRNMVFDAEWVAYVDELKEVLEFYQPHVVHFIGYNASEGIVLPAQDGEMKPVSDRALKLLFGRFTSRTHLVILDDCHTSEWAKSLAEVVNCVIGINDSTDASNTLRFAILLYSNISRGVSIQEAFDYSKSAMPPSARLDLLGKKPVVLLPVSSLSLLPANFGTSSPRPVPIDLCVAYAHEDQELRDQLMKHLEVLKNQELINIWDDGDVSQEKEWQQILKQFNKAKMILLLISPDFIASNFSSSNEMKSVIARYKRGDVNVICVVLRPVAWEDTPLSALPMLPKDGKPIIEGSSLGEVFAEIVRSIRLIIEERQKAWSTSLQPSLAPPVRYNLSDVFVKSGVPHMTFVEPGAFRYLKFTLTQTERGVVVEGPSGIGKTTAVRKALGTDVYIYYSGRNPNHQDKLQTLEEWHHGTVVIDDFHRLDVSLRQKIAAYLKLLADIESETKKLVIVGIPQSGQALVNLSPDVAARIDVVQWGKVEDEDVLHMIEKGEQALKIKLDRKTDLVLKAGGSLNIAQFLCFYICLQDGVFATLDQERTIYYHIHIDAVVSKVKTDLSRKFGSATKSFAALGGPYDNTCLRLLKELVSREDAHLSLARLKEIKDEFAHDINIERFINEQWSESLCQKFPESKEYFFFDQSTSTLAIYDPQFTFYLAHLEPDLPKLAKEVGKVMPLERHKVFLCYSAHRQDSKDSKWLKRLQEHLRPLERKGLIKTSDIANVPPGRLLETELQTLIKTSKVAILLVSTEFLASDSVMNDQLPKLLLQAQSGGITITSLIIAPCSLSDTDLDIFKPINPDKSLEQMTRVEWERTLVNLIRDVQRKLAEEESY